MFSYHFKKINEISILLLLLCGNLEKECFELSLEGSSIFHLYLGN
jgi:hypothetical protein